MKITEDSNPNTVNLDVAGLAGGLRALAASDGQLFSGWKEWPNMFDEIPALEQLASALKAAVDAADGCVVLAGAGTSGRLASAMARALNAAAGKLVAHYLAAGGDASLLVAQESAEDAAALAVTDLQRSLGIAEPHVLRPAKEVASTLPGVLVYVGISCGMSATYVGAQADWLLDAAEAGATTSVCLLGFNPLELVPSVPIHGWDRTFQQVATRVHGLRHEQCSKAKLARAMLLTPVVGPEPVCGSTRMKGGSATLLLLGAAIHAATSGDVAAAGPGALRSPSTALLACQTAMSTLYAQSAQLMPAITGAARALSSGGRVIYVSTGWAGLLALIDATECPPTYGANFDDVRAFTDTGYEAAGPAPPCVAAISLSASLVDSWEQVLISGARVNWAHNGLAACEATVLPTLTPNDVVVAVQLGAGSAALERTVAAARGASAQVVHLAIAPADAAVASQASAVVLSHSSVADSRLGADGVSLAELLACKLSLNAITTLAHVAKGTVYGNRMAAVRISNAKLLHRAIHIVQKLTGVSAEQAQLCIARGLYGDDVHSLDLSPSAVPGHVTAAGLAPKAVPIALLLAAELAAGLPVMSRPAALEVLQREPIIRAAIQARLRV